MRRTASAASVLAAVLLTGACGTGSGSGTGSATYDPDRDTSVYDEAKSSETFDETWRDPYEEQVSLPDGRDVRIWYSEDGSSLMEQHRAAGDGAWTEPATLLESDEPDPCQGITLTEEDGVVAVIADFGVYCYDGDPPSASVAAVGTGDLTEWDVHVTRGFDGWTEMKIAGGGVTWTGSGEELTWSAGDGFSEPSD